MYVYAYILSSNIQNQNKHLSNTAVQDNYSIRFVNRVIEILDAFHGNFTVKYWSKGKYKRRRHPLTLLTKVSRCLSTDRDISVIVQGLNVLLNDRSDQSVVELQIFEIRVSRGSS